jgi:hypothetical protein
MTVARTFVSYISDVCAKTCFFRRMRGIHGIAWLSPALRTISVDNLIRRATPKRGEAETEIPEAHQFALTA